MTTGPLNRLELSRKHKDDPVFVNKLSDLFTLSEFHQRCIPTADYSSSEDLVRAVVPTPSGKRRADAIMTDLRISEADARLALLLSPCHTDVEIDLIQTDFGSLWEQLTADILAKRIQYPWVYGRLLYDKFFDLYPSRTRSLSYDETTRLLEGCPLGVFQIGNRLIGPFGVLVSAEFRALFPVRSAPLWHCSDPSCGALHSVEFGRPLTSARRGALALKKSRLADGPGSEWFGFYREIVDKSDWYDHMYSESLPWLVASGFTANEQQHLLAELICRTNIRGRFPESKRFRSLLTGPAAAITSRLGPDFLLQTLLLATNEELTTAIENCLSASTVVIPATEIRRAPIFRSRSGWFDSVAECSCQGVRFRSSQRGFAIRHLRSVVTEVYSADEDQTELAWKVRHSNGKGVLQRVDQYLRDNPPAELIKELFFDSRCHITRLFKALRFGSFDAPSSPADELELISKIVWKLGFKARAYPRTHERFWAHLQAMRSVLQEAAEAQLEKKERIRSVGVNLFVSLEEVLDYGLALAGWALLGDHYTGPRFTFNLDRAREFTAETMNCSSSNTKNVEFDPKGKNTLFALVFGVELLVREIKDRLGRPADFVRTEDMPGHNKTPVDPFPLQHTALIFDIEPSSLALALETMESVTHELAAANIINIRNRLDHLRQDFPTADDLRSACDDLERIVLRLETSGICPPPAIDVGAKFDEYGRGAILYKDYAERAQSLPEPPSYSILPTSPGPMILLSALTFRGSSEIVRLQLKETSEFTALWHGYPRRRLRVRANGGEDEHSNEEITAATSESQMVPIADESTCLQTD